MYFVLNTNGRMEYTVKAKQGTSVGVEGAMAAICPKFIVVHEFNTPPLLRAGKPGTLPLHETYGMQSTPNDEQI